MNPPECSAIEEELDRYLSCVSLNSLKDTALEGCGMKHYSAEADYILMSQKVDAMETAASVGDVDAIRYLHHIAILANDALMRVTSPFRSKSDRPATALPAPDDEHDTDLDAIRSSARRLEDLQPPSLKDLHKRALEHARKEGLHAELPELLLSRMLFPESLSLTHQQYSASEIISSAIRKQVSRKMEQDVQHFIGTCTVWPAKHFADAREKLTEGKEFAMPAGLGSEHPHPKRSRSQSPDSRGSLGYSVFMALQQRRSSQRPDADYEKKLYAEEMRKLESYFTKLTRQSRLPADNRQLIPKPKYFEHLLELRWKWAADALPPLSPDTSVINRWLTAATNWVEWFTEGDLASVPWPDYITHRRGEGGKPTMATIREVLREELGKIAILLSDTASEIAATPELLNGRDEDFNSHYTGAIQKGAVDVVDALKVAGNHYGVVKNLEELVIPELKTAYRKKADNEKAASKTTAAKRSRKKRSNE